MSKKKTSRNIRITRSTLSSLRPKKEVYIVRDEVQRGFQIKVMPTGRAVYQVEARLGGTGRVKKFKVANVKDIGITEARERAREALDKIRSGIDPLQEKRAKMHEGKTLRELADEYIARDLKPSTKELYRSFVNKDLSKWLDRHVKNISKHEIVDWYKAGKKNRRKDQAFSFLNSIMKFAIGLEIVNDNPCILVANSKIRHKVSVRTGYLEVNTDLKKFLVALVDFNFARDSQKVARDVIVLVLSLGLRKNEAQKLMWKDVDFEGKTVNIPNTKNGRDHLLPMVPLTYSMLQYRKENSEGSKYVFRIRGECKSPHITDFRKTLVAVCKSADIDAVSPHDLRRTFATVLNSLDVGFADTKHLMNHTTKDVTVMIYIRPDINKLRKILSSVIDFYDHKIPVFKEKGVIPYSSNALRRILYGKGDLYPEETDDPNEYDPEWKKYSEYSLWED